MLIEPFPILLAVLPLVAYLLMLGAIRLSGRSIVTTGGRDIAALGIAIAGLVAIGPAELFFPSAAAYVFGPYVWIALIAFYALVVSLVALSMPPRLVVYGRKPDDLYEPLLAAARKIDPEAVAIDGWRVHLPSQGIHFRLDGFRDADHAQVIAFESGVPLAVWNDLLKHFREEVDNAKPAKPSRQGHIMVVVALVLLVIVMTIGIRNQAEVVQGFREWLWR